MDVRHYLEKSHPALAKPRSEGEALSELIVGELRGHRRPDAALKEIKEIRSDPEKVKQFVVRNSESVAEIIRSNRVDLPLKGIQTKTATVILDFLIDCPRRPMRCLAFNEIQPPPFDPEKQRWRCAGTRGCSSTRLRCRRPMPGISPRVLKEQPFQPGLSTPCTQRQIHIADRVCVIRV